MADVTAPLGATAARAELTQSPVEWPAVFAGAALATAIGLVMLGFGAAVGLSVTSAYEGEGVDARVFAIAAGLYFLWVQMISFGAGGYVAARLHRRMPVANQHEIDVRDGLHGLLVWAVGVIAAALIAGAGLSGAVQEDAGAAGALANQAAIVAAERAQEDLTPAPGADEQAGAAQAGLAEQRVEQARRAAVITGFITAASILVGAATAFFAAGSGGEHRDRNQVLPFFRLRPEQPRPQA